jgi:hypothetical protein
MATLASDELTEIRHILAQKQGDGVNWTKAQINAVAQAIEDLLVSTSFQNSVSSAINAATSPLVMTAAQKKYLFAVVVYRKYVRDIA